MKPLPRLVALLLFSGCVSISSVQMADTLGRGNFQVGLEPGLQVWGASKYTGAASELGHFDAAFRYGVAEDADVGLRVGMSMLEAQAKFLLTRPENPSLAVSLVPTVGAGTDLFLPHGGYDANAAVSGAVPVLVGFKTRGGSELVIGARVLGWVLFPGRGTQLVQTDPATGLALNPQPPRPRPSPGYVTAVGLSVGFAWRAWDTFVLLPELAMAYDVFSSQGGWWLDSNLGPLTFQFKLGVLFGRMPARRSL